MPATPIETKAPWWRVPMMWLVIGGPAAVVVAAILTAVIAFRAGDTPIHEADQVHTPSQTPANQARNHAAAPRQ
jgi:hypothetical protein